MKKYFSILFIFLACGNTNTEPHVYEPIISIPEAVNTSYTYLADYINENDSATVQSLQAALDAAAGDTLYCGPYYVKTGINQLPSNIVILGAGVTIKGPQTPSNGNVDGILSSDGKQNITIDGINFDGTNTPGGNEFFVKSFTDFYNTKNVTIKNCRAIGGSYAFVRYADMCHNFEIYNNYQLGGDCMVIGNHNRDNGKSGNFYIHHNFRDGTGGKSEGVGIASGYNRTTGEVWYTDSVRVENNIIINNNQSYAIIFSAVRGSAVRNNFIWNCKAGFTAANEKESAGIVPGFASRDTIEGNVFEGLPAQIGNNYIDGLFGINAVKDSFLVRNNKFFGFNYSGVRLGYYDQDIYYNGDPVNGTVDPTTVNRPVKFVRLLNNVIDSTNCENSAGYFYPAPVGALVFYGLENSTMTANTINGTLAKHLIVSEAGTISATISGNSWQAADKSPLFGRSKYLTISSGTVSLSCSATDEGAVAYRWEQLAGLPATIADNNAQNTTASGMYNGWYLFKVTGTDNTGKDAISMQAVMVSGFLDPPNGSAANRSSIGKFKK